MAALSEDDAHDLIYCWELWARPDQLAPPGDWFHWLLKGGRGSGKTRTGAEWVLDREREGARRIAIVGETAADNRDILVEGDSGILESAPPWNKPDYQPSKRRLTWQSGAVATLYSGDAPGQLRGPQHDTAWLDELAKWQYPEEALANLEMGLRLGMDPRAVITTTPRNIPVVRKLVADSDVVVTNASTYANLSNLAPRFIARVVKRYEGTRLGRQELRGEVLEDVPGALWNRPLIETHRLLGPEQLPDLVRIGVAIDPQAADPDQDELGHDEGEGPETGIVAAGLGEDGRGYVLADGSGDYAPHEWATKGLALLKHHNGDVLIAERNNGGAMVESTIRAVDDKANVQTVWASRGKITRAEPISALYEQGRVSHVGTFGLLEDELCTYTGAPGERSPNRLDALVWILTELMVDDENPTPHYNPARHIYRPPKKRGPNPGATL